MTAETWRNAPRCPEHEEYQEDCSMCFAEALEGGLQWLVDEVLYGTEAHLIAEQGPFSHAFMISFEEMPLFAVRYTQGEKDALVIPPGAAAQVRTLERSARRNVEHLDAQISELELGDDGDALHRALQARGVAGARLDRIEHWATDRLEVKQPRAGGARLSVPPGRRAT